jgi:sec-independent protein translocase protein TatB
VNLDPEKLIVVFVIAMLVLGPKRLPEAARTMGRWLAEVRKYTSGFQNEFRGLLDEPRQQTSALRDEFNSAFAEPRKALEAGAREVQAAANSAGAEVAASPSPALSEPSLARPEPAPFLPQDTVGASPNAVPDDPSLN